MLKTLMRKADRSLIRVELDKSDTGQPVLADVLPPACGSCHAFRNGDCLKHAKAVKPDQSGCSEHRWFAGYAALLKAVEQFSLSQNQSSLEALLEDFTQVDEKHVDLLDLLESGLKPQPKLSAPVTNSPRVNWVSPMSIGIVMDRPRWLSAAAGQTRVEAPRPQLLEA